MSNLQKHKIPTTHAQARDMLNGMQESWPIVYKTYLRRLSDDTIALVYFDTEIVHYNTDGTLTLWTDGFDTVTTKTRINAALGDRGRVWSQHKVWYYYPLPIHQATRVLFKEGMTV